MKSETLIKLVANDNILIKKVLFFLGLELWWCAGSKQIWLSDVMSGDIVTVFMKLYDDSIVEKPIEVKRKDILLNIELDREHVAGKAFLEILGSIKAFSYGINLETLEPRKTLDNPFFGSKCIEEIAIKLDLLSNH